MPLIVPGITQQPTKKGNDRNNNEDNKPQGDKSTVHAFQSAPGPVVPQDTSVFETKPSREEQEARVKELNK